MVKVTIKYILIVLCIILFIFVFKKCGMIYNRLKEEKEILSALNSDIQYEYITDNEMKAHIKAKENESEEYDITPIIKNYIENVNLCVKNHLKNDNEYSIIEYSLSSSLVMHGLRKEGFEYIYNLITDEDINKYKLGIFDADLIKELQGILKYKYDDNIIKWYIENDMDKNIELPFNTYIKFIHSDKKSNNVRRIKSVRFVDEKDFNCIVVYEKNDEKVYTEKLYINTKNYKNKKKYLINGFNKIYYSQTQTPRLTFGQHDYDEAMRKEIEDNPSEDMSHLNDSMNEGKKYEEMQTISWEEFEKLLNQGKKQ